MSIIPIIYNQGTGLLNPIGEGSGLPVIVDDLIVNGNLTVLGTSNLVGNVTCDTNLTVTNTIASADLIVSNNAIIDAGIGHDNSSLFLLPPVHGTLNQVLTIVDDTVDPIETEWADVPSITSYVDYDLLTSKLIHDVLSVQTPIDNLTIDTSIGITGQRFKLPGNTTTATNNQVLAILNSAANPKTTSWITPSIFSPTTGSVDNFSTGTTTTTAVAATLVNTPLLQPGIYIINYEVVLLIVGSRTFSFQANAISTSAGGIFTTPVTGLRQSLAIPYASTVLALPESQIIGGCGVVNLAVATTLFLVTFNRFTGGTYTSAGFIRYTKIS
jgi:hypothetical protein